MRIRVLLSCLLLLDSAANAQEAPIARVDISPSEVAVGEPLRLRVTVLVPTWFAQPPDFPSFELPNAVVRLPPDSSRPTSERVGRDTWSGVVRDYQVFPLVSANFELDELDIQVMYANPGSSPTSVSVALPPVRFSAVVPSGAEDLMPYIAGKSLRLGRQVEGDTTLLSVGDALTVTYSAELDGLPAMFLPPMVDREEVAGIATYLETPVVEDDTVSPRSESITYVFEAGGTFALPPLQIRWWNTTTSSIEAAEVPEMTIEVEGSAVMAESEATESKQGVGLPAIVLGLGLAILAVLAPRLSSTIRSNVSQYRITRQNSESYRFRHLRKALRRSAPGAYAMLLEWANHLEPPLGARSFATAYGSSELQNQIDLLSRQRHAQASQDVDLRTLEHELVSARQRLLRRSVEQTQTTVPTLNP